MFSRRAKVSPIKQIGANFTQTSRTKESWSRKFRPFLVKYESCNRQATKNPLTKQNKIVPIWRGTSKPAIAHGTRPKLTPGMRLTGAVIRRMIKLKTLVKRRWGHNINCSNSALPPYVVPYTKNAFRSTTPARYNQTVNVFFLQLEHLQSSSARSA